MKKVDDLAFEIFEEAKRDGDDMTMEDALEMAEMEIKAKAIKRYEKSGEGRKKITKVRTVDADKLALFSVLVNALNEAGIQFDNKNESELMFNYCGKEFSIKLILHRKKK